MQKLLGVKREYEETNTELNKEGKGLRTEIQILKEDLGRTRDRYIYFGLL